VRVISKKKLQEFWESRKADSEVAERDLLVWYKASIHADWSNFSTLKQTFGSADSVGNCVVFDVGSNRFRLIGRVNYAKGIVYVLRVMDHKEYDKKLWVKTCGCHKPPPPRPSTARKMVPKGKAGHPKGKKGR
jgi:mRNA interferase HigB